MRARLAGMLRYGVPALALAALVAPAVVARAEGDCADLPDVLTEAADKAQIRCALSRSRAASMARGISVVDTGAEVEAARFAINFEFGSAGITPASQDLLTRLAEVIASDDELRTAAYLIDGHTDAVGDDAANQALGAARAQSTAAHLLGQVDFPLVIMTRSFGETQLLDPDDPASARNRRVEITPVALE